jgi:hypothetical protein
VDGRWTLLPTAPPIDAVDELAETVAWQLLLRWGVVFRDVYLKERLDVPWREILWALRRLEARGLIRGGHFVTGVTGEQFAEETTIPLLRPRRAARPGVQPGQPSLERDDQRSTEALIGAGRARVAGAPVTDGRPRTA